MNTSRILFLILLLFFSNRTVFAYEPLLRFTDLVSGPDTGLNDGKGSGAIVTVWGQNLGSKQGASKIFFKDSTGKEHQPAHIYYWKNADGELPGGPSDLYSSHKMQEIAFSIPDSAVGDGEIFITFGFQNTKSNSLPFRVSETGSIYWVSPLGDNSNACSYASPCEYINGDIAPGRYGGIGDERLSAGDIVYSLGVEEPELCTGGRCIGMFIRGGKGNSDNLISFIAYPGLRSSITSSNVGLEPYNSGYLSLSKYAIYVGYRDPSLTPNPGNPVTSNTHITVDRGRYTGNYLGQISGTCITGWSGAIKGTSIGGENAKIFGNEIDNIGCPNTSRFQHTTYMSVRDQTANLSEAWDFSYNYLHDNFPMFGLHFYDEQLNSTENGDDCGILNGTIRVTNNVIVNQWGPGINIATKDTSGIRNPCWSANIHIENNLLMNTGLGDALEENVTPQPRAINIGGYMAPNTIHIINNTIYNWGDNKTIAANGGPRGTVVSLELGSVNPSIVFQNNAYFSNILESNEDKFVSIKSTLTNITGRNNSFYTADDTPTTAIPPTDWENSIIIKAPFLNFINHNLSLSLGSKLIDAGSTVGKLPIVEQRHDIYGNLRLKYDIGAVEYLLKPNAPVISIQE